MIELADRLADASGEILRTYWRRHGTVDRKGDSSPVTQADREAEAAMRTLIESHFPDHGIIGEEHGSVRENSPWQWVLDPIDGTRSFIAGYPIFTTLIGLAHEGVPVLGVIDQPIARERWKGARGNASTCNGKKISTRGAQKLADAVIATTSLDYFKPDEAESYARLREQCGGALPTGDAYAYAMLSSGQLDLVIDAGLKVYDFCALVPVIEGAGGVITDWEGVPVTLATQGRVIAAATKPLHAEALKFLKSSSKAA